MTAALATVAVVALACLSLVAYLLRRQDAERRLWTQERQMLIARVQHPEVYHPIQLPPETSAGAPEEKRAEEPDEIDLVGKVIPGGDES